MLTKYHRSITRTALATHVSEAALDEIVAANLAQDAWIYQLGTKAHFHFDNNGIAEGLSYIEDLHRTIEALTQEASGGQAQRVAFGRLCHAAQDFWGLTGKGVPGVQGHTKSPCNDPRCPQS